jgi:hypothetical protein
MADEEATCSVGGLTSAERIAEGVIAELLPSALVRGWKENIG